MKHSAHCPRCQGRVFFKVRRLQMPDARYSSTSSFNPVTMTGVDSDDAIEIEAWVCDGCGYTELYAKPMKLLRQMAEWNQGGVTKVDRSTEEGPFR